MSTTVTSDCPRKRFEAFRAEKLNILYLTSDRSVRQMSQELRRLCPSSVGLDFETSFKTRPSFSPWSGALRLIQIGIDEPRRGIAPAQIVVDCHRADPRPLAWLLRSRKVEKLIHNQRFEQQWAMVHLGTPVLNVYDTCKAMEVVQRQIRSQAEQPEWYAPHDNRLGTLASRYLGLDMPKEEGGSDWGRRELRPEQLVYAALDVAVMPALTAQVRRMAAEVGATEDVEAAIAAACEAVTKRVGRRCDDQGDDLPRVRRAMQRARCRDELRHIYLAARQMTLTTDSRRGLDQLYRERMKCLS